MLSVWRKNGDHYERFKYLDNDNEIRDFTPDSDWSFIDFKNKIKEEWKTHKYISDKLYIAVHNIKP